jgi:hypothetical protein
VTPQGTEVGYLSILLYIVCEYILGTSRAEIAIELETLIATISLSSSLHRRVPSHASSARPVWLPASVKAKA